jgi:hypothetical protein
MRVGAQRYAAACFFRLSQQVNIQVLAIRITVDFDCFVQLGSTVKDSRPIRGQAGNCRFDRVDGREFESTDCVMLRDNALSGLL